MIEIGNNVITAITIGSTTPTKIDWGNDQVWPTQQPQPTTFLVVLDGDGKYVPSGTSSGYINVSASTGSWMVSSNQSWVAANRDSSTRAAYSVNEYNQSLETRRATLSFKINNTEYDTFVLTQNAAAPYLNVSVSSTTISEGTMNGTVRVTTNIPTWDVWVTYKNPNSDWFTARKDSLTSVTWTVTENQGMSYRQAVMTVSGMGISKEVQIIQNAGYIFQFGDGTKDKTVYSTSAANQNYQISITSSYHGEALKVIPTITNNNMSATMELLSSGSSGYYVYRLAYPVRSSVATGLFTVVFRQETTNQLIYFRMEQSGALATLYVYPESITAESASTTGAITITTNAPSWKASMSNWITMSSSGADYLNYYIPANNQSTQRDGSITVTAATAQKTVSVTQKAAYTPSGVDGVIASATSEGWVLGVVTASTTPIGDVRGICVVSPSPITGNYYAHIGTMEYQNNSGTYTITNRDYQISAGATFAASGVTYNGIYIVTPNVNQVINSVSQFGVYPAP